MKRLLSLFGALALALIALAANPSPPTAQATGNCGIATLRLYSSPNQTGTMRQYCYATADADIQSEPGSVMGPLSDGGFLPDFDTVPTTSGLSSGQLIVQIGGSHALRVCFWNGATYTGTLTAQPFQNGGITNFNFTGANDNVTGSFYWQEGVGLC